MGYALAAELNRYPGPMHVLEHREALRLTPAQRSVIERLMAAHKAQARELGAQVVALERELDEAFASGRATEAQVDDILARWGAATASLRGAHLKTHLATTALLSPAQVDRYVEVRGYAGTPGPAGHRNHGSHGGH